MIEPTLVKIEGTDTYTASAVCECGHVTSAEVQGYDLFRYNQGDFVQDAFPYLSGGTREALFLTGVCVVCWYNMMGPED